ncbi:MAG: 2-amino-4-hydroxy-6-hydroxymethyldihydropteridine diphosphokinase, partial [Candidatus Omnitrophota bacterium]
NLGDRQQNISRAIEELKNCKGINFIRSSSVYETDPVSDIPQGKFLNGVIEIDTTLTPRVLLKELNRIEEMLGRKRTVKDAPRQIDLDILYYGRDVIEEDGLTIPHPKIPEREFVLRGLKELGRI